MAVSRPEPGPLTKTSIFFMPWSIARRPAASAAICAANGVDLREPLKPTVPAEAQEILEATGIDRNMRTKDLTDDQVTQLRDYIEGNLKVEGDLRREVQADIRRKIEIGCYQGLRHRRGLPVRGQRTKTNARTRKGPKRTIAGKKKAR